MKICPICKQNYNDDSLNFCLIDGTQLIPTAKKLETETVQYQKESTNKTTDRFENLAADQNRQNAVITNQTKSSSSKNLLWVLLAFGLLILGCGGGILGLYTYLSKSNLLTAKNNSPKPNQPVNVKNTNSNSINTESTPPQTDAGAARTGNYTMEKYLQLQPKTSYQEVVKLLGSKGEELSKSTLINTTSGSYKWSNDDSEYIIVIFINGQLSSRSQAGLNKRITPNLTMEKFQQIKDKMTYEQAAAILGEGDEINKSVFPNSTIITYQWKTDAFGYVNLSFLNGKLNSKSQSGLN